MLDKITPTQLFLVQLASFAIGMTLIWFIYLKGLFRSMQERSAGIKKSLDDAAEAQAKAEAQNAENARQLASFQAQSKQILDEARSEGAKLKEDMLAQARKEQEALLAQARAQVAQETQDALRQIKGEAASLVVAATRKLLEKDLDAKSQEELAARFIKELEKV
jgi:F-type H+-transporting ATPase subunit b